MNDGRWLERTIITIVSGVLLTAIINLYIKNSEARLEDAKWRGRTEERIDYMVKAFERIERKLEAIP